MQLVQRGEDIEDLEEELAGRVETSQELKEEILVQVMLLGEKKVVEQEGFPIRVYLKNAHCESAVKKLIMMVKEDSPQNEVLFHLGKLQILGDDLIELLLSQTQDQKLSFWVMLLMVKMTNSAANELSVERMSLYPQYQTLLANHKRQFLKPMVLRTLLQHLAHCVGLPEQSLQKPEKQVIQIVLTLVRNLLAIQTENEPELRCEFIRQLIQEQLLEVMLFLGSSFDKSYSQEIDLLLLQIYYHIFTSFTPNYLVQNRTPLLMAPKRASISGRPRSFVCNFISKKTQRIYHSLKAAKEAPPINRLDKQRKKPNLISKIKVQLLGPKQPIDSKIASIECGQNPINFQQKIKQYSRQFLKFVFAKLQKHLFQEIYRFQPEALSLAKQRVNVNHKAMYLWLSSWAMQMVRQLQRVEKTPEMDLGSIGPTVQPSFFMLLYSIIREPQTPNRKRPLFRPDQAAAVFALKDYLSIVYRMWFSFDPLVKEANQTILTHLFRHDMRKLLDYVLKADAKEPILILHYYFQLLQLYANGRVLAVLDTHRPVGYREEDERQEEGEGEREGHDQKRNQLKYRQRRLTELNQRASYFRFKVIEKHMLALRRHKEDKEVVAAVFSFLTKSTQKLDAKWILFQMDFLLVLLQLYNSDFSRKVENINHCKFIRKLFKEFLDLFALNTLLPLEALFRTESKDLAELILTNYEGLTAARKPDSANFEEEPEEQNEEYEEEQENEPACQQ